MAQIYNTDLSNELIQGASIQVNRDLVPNQLAEKVVPVMEVNPQLLRKAKIFSTSSLANATSANTYTASTIKETYITGITISYARDVSATSTIFSLLLMTDEGNAAIIKIPGITLTADSGSLSFNTTYPIKLKKGGVSTLTSDTNVGNFKVSCTLVGYEL